MATKNCLRCDWQGETKEPTCPNCGAQPLYGVTGLPSTAMPIAPVSAPSHGSARSEPAADPVEPARRPIRSIVAFVLTALVLTITLGTWLNADGEPSTPASEGSPPAAVSPSPTPEGIDAAESPDTRTLSRTVGGVDLTFAVPRSGWTNGPIVHPPDGGEFRQGGFAITKDTGGFQAAEAAIFWTTLPESGHVDLCTDLLSPTVGSSAADLATVMATAPGATVISEPSQVAIDGFSGEHMVLIVREDRGCDPGYFFSWPTECWGPCWTRTKVGDTIRVWIVDVDGTLLIIEAETAKRAGPTLEGDIEQIVGSIRFVRSKVEIAEGFMEARNAYDTQQTMSLLADEGATTVLQFRNQMDKDMPSVRLSRDELALALEAEQTYGVRYGNVRCRQNNGGGSSDVICTYSMDSKLRRLAGFRPVESAFRLRIRDGRIDLLSFPWLNISWNPGGYYPAEFERFVLWLDAAHPEAIDAEHPTAVRSRLFRSWGQEWILRLTRESLDLLAGYLQEYAHSVREPQTPA